MIGFVMAIALLDTLAYPAGKADFSSRLGQEKVKCEDLVEGFCDFLWVEPRLGNYDFHYGKKSWAIQFGKTENDIPYGRYIFLNALQKHFGDLPRDLRYALQRTKFLGTLKPFLQRKVPKKVQLADLAKPEFLRSVFHPLNDAVMLVGWERTEKDFPGFIRLSSYEINSEISRAYDKHVDKIWSELFVAVWQKQEGWLRTKRQFEELRGEYKQFLEEDPLLSASLRHYSINNIERLKLRIPGEALDVSNDSTWHDCGIDIHNAFFTQADHDVTVCAGYMESSSPLLTLAHEIGHSYSIGARLYAYLRQSLYGKSVLELWNRSRDGKHFACEEWGSFKDDFVKKIKALEPYEFEDMPRLSPFISKELRAFPDSDEIVKLADRFTRAAVRSEIDNMTLERMLKPEEILTSGQTAKNFRYLNAVANGYRWPKDLYALDTETLQFEMLFSEEYRCLLEKKIPETEALKLAIDEAMRIVNHLWAMYIRVPGKLSKYKEAHNEEFAQNIEEDLVDSISSKVVARYLKRNPNVGERRFEYLASMSKFCSSPSFTQKYPDETVVLGKYSNEPHSIGADRRRKMLTPEIRDALSCE